jgi:hypothetical protein
LENYRSIYNQWQIKTIIVAITEGNRRFNEMQPLIDGISAKVLSLELKDLELNSLVRTISDIVFSCPHSTSLCFVSHAIAFSHLLQSLLGG